MLNISKTDDRKQRKYETMSYELDTYGTFHIRLFEFSVRSFGALSNIFSEITSATLSLDMNLRLAKDQADRQGPWTSCLMYRMKKNSMFLAYSPLSLPLARHLTEIPHLGGTPADLSQARELVDAWLAQGLDRAKLEPYNVLLSYPETDDPGQIFLYDGDGETVYASQKFEEILRPEQNHSDVVPPFNAYSTRGDPRVTIRLYSRL